MLANFCEGLYHDYYKSWFEAQTSARSLPHGGGILTVCSSPTNETEVYQTRWLVAMISTHSGKPIRRTGQCEEQEERSENEEEKKN
jgi:hypothetical protein